MKRLSSWLRLCLLLPLGVVLSACLSPSQPPLKLGTNLWPGYEPLYLARSEGMLTDDQVLLVELLSASEVMRAFRNGAIDAAALTLDEVINLRAMGLKPVVVQVTNFSDGADVILARQGLNSVADLRGRRVGVEATALGAYMLSRALGLAGMTPADVQVIRLEVNEHRNAFLRGEVDAVVTFDPVRQPLLAAGAVQVFDSSMIPGEIVDVLVVREELLHAHQDHIQHLIHAWQQSLTLIETRPEASARQMAQRLKLSAEDVIKSHANLEFPGWEQSRRLMSQADPVLQQQAVTLAESMYEHQLIDAVPDLEGLIYSHYPAE